MFTPWTKGWIAIGGFQIMGLIGLIQKFVLPKLGQAKILARIFFCQNLDKYFVRRATFLDSNQLSAKIYGYQNFGKVNFGTKPIELCILHF